MNYYVLQIVGDVEPVLHGPYTSQDARDRRARALRVEDRQQENGLYRIESAAPVSVDGYCGHELKNPSEL